MSTPPDFKPWELKWEPAHVKRFWDWWGSNPFFENTYFSKNNGASLIDHVRTHAGLQGTVVDLGAGPGFLVDHLLALGVRTLAIDQSPASIERLNRKYANHPAFVGGRASSSDSVPAQDGEADVVLLVETVEHIDDAALNFVLREARRILKPGGRIFVTTPNEENLELLKVMCPSCGCTFHNYQHVRSWSRDSLMQKMREHGFSTLVCERTLFSSGSRLKRGLRRLMYSVLNRQLPHLFYVGRAA
jgi:SAM-dependent methyltransferase